MRLSKPAPLRWNIAILIIFAVYAYGCSWSYIDVNTRTDAEPEIVAISAAPSPSAQIKIARKHRGFNETFVSIDGEFVAALKRGEWISVDVALGSHTIGVAWVDHVDPTADEIPPGFRENISGSYDFILIYRLVTTEIDINTTSPGHYLIWFDWNPWNETTTIAAADEWPNFIELRENKQVIVSISPDD